MSRAFLAITPIRKRRTNEGSRNLITPLEATFHIFFISVFVLSSYLPLRSTQVAGKSHFSIRHTRNNIKRLGEGNKCWSTAISLNYRTRIQITRGMWVGDERWHEVEEWLEDKDINWVITSFRSSGSILQSKGSILRQRRASCINYRPFVHCLNYCSGFGNNLRTSNAHT